MHALRQMAHHHLLIFFFQVLWSLFVCRTLGRSLKMVKCAGSQDGGESGNLRAITHQTDREEEVATKAVVASCYLYF